MSEFGQKQSVEAQPIRHRIRMRNEARMKPRTFLGLKWIEWAVIAAMLLIVARFYWAPELRAAEDALFVRLGIDPALKLVLTVPVAIYLSWRYFKREQFKAKSAGRPVVRRSVFAICAGLLAIAAALLFIH
jgi:hypothetical protein